MRSFPDLRHEGGAAVNFFVKQNGKDVRRVVWQDFVCYVIVIIHPLVLEGESEKWRILCTIAASGSGIKTLQALYGCVSEKGDHMGWPDSETNYKFVVHPREEIPVIS